MWAWMPLHTHTHIYIYTYVSHLFWHVGSDQTSSYLDYQLPRAKTLVKVDPTAADRAQGPQQVCVIELVELISDGPRIIKSECRQHWPSRCSSPPRRRHRNLGSGNPNYEPEPLDQSMLDLAFDPAKQSLHNTATSPEAQCTIDRRKATIDRRPLC